MSHQCSCGRDLNNNYVGYTNAYSNSSSGLDRDAAGGITTGPKSASMSTRSMSSAGAQTQLTAKVMFGTVGSIKALREKEKSSHVATRAGDRRN